MTFTVTRQRAQEVHDLARARAGLRYAYGGAFTRDPRVSTDCSGLVLQTAAWYGGRTDWPGNRYGSTESFRLNHKIVYDLGFKRLPAGGPAALPFRPVMLVGLQHGGGGVNSHTACTLMTMDYPGGPVVQSVRGVDWESRGSGVFLYDGARAWNDPLFHDFWYLDAKLEGAAVGPAPALSRADRYALAIIIEGRTARTGQGQLDHPVITERGSKIALATALVETDLVMYANRADPESLTYPHDAVGSDHNSSGLFQQRPPWWGTVADRMDPARSAALFYNALAKRDYNNPAKSPGSYAQSVQQSAFPDRYDQRYEEAERLYDRLATTDPLDPWEELFMSNTPLESISLYATPGETRRFTPAEMLQSIDGMTHRALVERDARLGDPDALARIVRVARGEGKYRDQASINHARAVLAEIEAATPEILQNYLKGQTA